MILSLFHINRGDYFEKIIGESIDITNDFQLRWWHITQ